MKRKILSMVFAIMLVLPTLFVLPLQTAHAAPEVYGTTSNLLVNGGAEQSARNFPYYGWIEDKSDGGTGAAYGAFTSITRGSKQMNPQSGSYFFAPMQKDENVMKKMVTNISSAMTYNINNLPGLIPGGYTPGSMPSGLNPGNIPAGMPSIPGLPSIPNLVSVPGMPNVSDITGLPGIPTLPGMPGLPGANSSGLPNVPGVTDVINFIAQIINLIGENRAMHTDLAQTVDISLFKDYIDTNQQTFSFSGYYRADDGEDKAQIFIYVLNAFGSQLASYTSGQTNKLAWQQYSLNNTNLPPGARKIKVVLRVSKSFGHEYYAGAFDSLSLTMPVYKLPYTMSGTKMDAGLTVKITPGISISGVTYQSLNPDIASVDSGGTVKGLKAGVARIQVIDPIFKDVKNETTVTVSESTTPPALEQPLLQDQQPVVPIDMILDKTDYPQGGNNKITVTVTNVTQDDLNNSVWYCPAGEAHNSTKGWWYKLTKTGTNTLELGTSTIGSFEMRLYSNPNNRSDTTLLKKIPFTVSSATTMPPAQPPTSTSPAITLDKTNYAPDEMITVTINGDIAGKTLIMAKQESPHTDYLKLTDARNQAVLDNWKTPVNVGIYEMRLYPMSASPRTETDLITKTQFTVSAAATQPPAETPPVETPPAPGPSDNVATAFTAKAIESGVKLEWPIAEGPQTYRVFRSKTAGNQGISITDFAITATNYVDVNVDPNTTYYYTACQLLKDADPWNDIPEQLGPLSEVLSVTTGNVILEPEGKGEKHFILMKLEDPNMSVDGIKQEIDPGRGTTPINRNGRVILPIRAVIEAIGGSVGWEDSTSQITLNTHTPEVIMWLDKKDLTIDGESGDMDVAPVSLNNRTMVPVRFAAESTGCRVEWLNATSEIVVVFYLSESSASSVHETPAMRDVPDTNNTLKLQTDTKSDSAGTVKTQLEEERGVD